MKRDPVHGKEYGPFQHALKQKGFESVLKKMGIDDELSGVRLLMFDGTDAKWHVWKVKFVTFTMTFQTYSQDRYAIHLFCIFRIHTKYNLCKRIREFILDADNIDGRDDC